MEEEFNESVYYNEIDKKSFRDYMLNERNSIEIDKKKFWNSLNNRQKRGLILLCQNRTPDYLEKRLGLGQNHLPRFRKQIQRKFLVASV